jgi:outer membrane protein assembly factor BamB
VEISPFGGIVTRQLSLMPSAVLDLESVSRVPHDPAPASEGKPVLFFSAAGGAVVSLWGAPAVELPSLGGVPLAAAGRGDKAAVALADGRLLLLSLPNGETLWSGQTHLVPGQDAGAVNILYDERGIYVLSKSGVAGFAEDGRRLWLMRIEGSAVVPAFSDEGFLYSGGKDWILYAYRPEERIRRRQRSLYGDAAEGSYGTANPRPSSQAAYYFRFDDREMRERLSRINRLVQAGTVGTEEKEFTAYLMEIADSVGPNPSREALIQAPVQVERRVEALRLLGYLGSRETIPFLAGLYAQDRDGLVKAAAAEAIGRIGVDPGGHALRAFTTLIFPPVPYRDDAVLAATAAAAGALCRFSGPPLSGDGIKLLVALAQDDRPRAVQNRAREELASLR